MFRFNMLCIRLTPYQIVIMKIYLEILEMSYIQVWKRNRQLSNDIHNGQEYNLGFVSKLLRRKHFSNYWNFHTKVLYFTNRTLEFRCVTHNKFCAINKMQFRSEYITLDVNLKKGWYIYRSARVQKSFVNGQLLFSKIVILHRSNIGKELNCTFVQ